MRGPRARLLAFVRASGRRCEAYADAALGFSFSLLIILGQFWKKILLPFIAPGSYGGTNPDVRA